MLSEKEPIGFSKNYELSAQPSTAEDVDNEAPTEDDWIKSIVYLTVINYNEFLTATDWFLTE